VTSTFATLRRPQWRYPAIGMVIWLVVGALALGSALDFPLVTMLLLLAPLVMIPLGCRLTTDMPLLEPVALVAASVLIPAAMLGNGMAGALLCTPWLAVSTARAVVTWHAFTRERFELGQLGLCVAVTYLVVGASFNVLFHAGIVLFDVGEAIMQLTAVHFQYAGYGALVVVVCVFRAMPPNTRRFLAPIVVLTAVGPPLVALGFTWHVGVAQIGGAIVLAVALWSVAILTLLIVVPRRRGATKALLTVSSLAVLAPMGLAITWASAEYFDLPALSVPDMARVHGTLNAVGFVVCGMLAWRLDAASRDAASRDPASRDPASRDPASRDPAGSNTETRTDSVAPSDAGVRGDRR